MQSSRAVALLAAVLVLPVAAVAQDAGKKTQVPAVTFTGCVSDKPTPSGDFTFTDSTSGNKFRLTGKSVKKFAGQQVELVSSPSKSLTVKGGLYPSPNAAAQAGALDPAQEAIARQPGGAGTGIGSSDLPEFRVGQVRAASGKCQ